MHTKLIQCNYYGKNIITAIVWYLAINFESLTTSCALLIAISNVSISNSNCAITLLMSLFLYTLLSRNPSNNFVIYFLIYKIGSVRSEHVTTFWICRCGLVTRMRSYLTRPDFDAFTECDAVLGKKVSLQRLNGKLQSIIRRSYSDINS